MGYRQVALALRNEQGLCISGKTVLRLMREEGLFCKIRRKRYSSYIHLSLHSKNFTPIFLSR